MSINTSSANSVQPMTEGQRDKTFRAYTTTQAKEYASSRGGYPPRLIEEVIKAHASTGGGFNKLLDLGCGPGNSTRDLAVHFDHAIGLDPSASMVAAASEIGGDARKGPIRFIQSEAEVCADIPDQSIDLVIAATSGHWFDMDRFWPTADRILKPGGTVAFFTIWRIFVHPQKTPHAKEIQKILIEFEQGDSGLGPVQVAGNWSMMGLYHDLKMPWHASPPITTAFLESGYRRQVWNFNGEPSDDGSYVCGEREMTLEDAERAISTISAVTRWREAHPDLAGTEKDCVRMTFERIRKILEPEKTEKISWVGGSVVVSVKKT